MILVDNALKHTPADGTVIISVAAVAICLILTVKGLTEVAPLHIFERFYLTVHVVASANSEGYPLLVRIRRATVLGFIGSQPLEIAVKRLRGFAPDFGGTVAVPLQFFESNS